MTEIVLRTGSIAADTPTPGGEEAPGTETEPTERRRPRPVRSGWAALEGAALIGAMTWAGLSVYDAWAHGQASRTVVPGVSIAGVSVGGADEAELRAMALQAGKAASGRALRLRAHAQVVETTPRDLGATAETERSMEAALAVARSGFLLVDLQAKLLAASGGVDIPVGYRFDESKALARLQALAPQVETPSLPTRMDFDGRKVIAAERGVALLAYDSLSAVATGLAAGAEEIELVVSSKPAVEDPLAAVADELDISVVLGSFDTPYQADELHKDRTHNLKVGSTAVDGFVLLPGEVFSFNETVGDRSAENGYRYGTGISGGQLVDVLGGGICQVSSTLFGAGFFAGLDIASARPHSRPSSYVDMGLDSTVVYPSIDMKLRNGYDFAVVLHMSVSQGKVRAEVLGPRRPYQVAFERTLEESLPYNTVWRDDARLRTGTQTLAQRGRRGFKLKRTRKLLQSGEVVATEAWDLHYPPTTEILRRGTSATGERPEDKQRPALREPAPALKIVQ